MRRRLCTLLVPALKDEHGQALPFMFFLIVLFIGASGLSVDLGHAYVCHRELQASTDAAALAGAQELASPSATVASVDAAVSGYSSVPGGLNANANLQETASSVSTTLECLGTIAAEGVSCSGSPTGANAIQVQQTATIPTFVIRALSVFGVKAAQALNIGAVATAAMKGSVSPYNVAVVLDATYSMNDNDSDANCGNTRIHCALQGVQSLLQGLSPCTASSTSADCTPFDLVSLFTFPNAQANTAVDDTTCGSGTPTNLQYSTPVPGATWVATNFSSTNPTYQIADYGSDYSSTNKQGGAFNTSSPIVIATGAGSCQGIQAIGGESTYYAGAIYAALSSLAAAQQANPDSSNALIILSDGDANASNSKFSPTNGLSLTSTGAYPSAKDECHQAITAAKTAQSMTRTTVFTVAYGASNSASGSCSTDSQGGESISACSALQQMATSSADFYSDATASQNQGQCVSSTNSGINSLSSIFTSIGTSLSGARLIPNGTT
jgi:hypothetical protein